MNNKKEIYLIFKVLLISFFIGVFIYIILFLIPNINSTKKEVESFLKKDHILKQLNKDEFIYFSSEKPSCDLTIDLSIECSSNKSILGLKSNGEYYSLAKSPSMIKISNYSRSNFIPIVDFELKFSNIIITDSILLNNLTINKFNLLDNFNYKEYLKYFKNLNLEIIAQSNNDKDLSFVNLKIENIFFNYENKFKFNIIRRDLDSNIDNNDTIKIKLPSEDLLIKKAEESLVLKKYFKVNDLFYSLYQLNCLNEKNIFNLNKYIFNIHEKEILDKDYFKSITGPQLEILLNNYSFPFLTPFLKIWRSELLNEDKNYFKRTAYPIIDIYLIKSFFIAEKYPQLLNRYLNESMFKYIEEMNEKRD